MKRTLVLATALLLLLPACGDLFDKAAAVVNGRKITTGELEAGLEGLRSTERYKQLAGQGDVQAVERQFVQGLLSTLVRRAVLEPEAEAAGVEVTEADVAEQIDAIKADFPTESAFEEALKEQALDLEGLRGLVRDRLLEQSLKEKVTEGAGAGEQELRDYYEQHSDEFQQTRAQHILVEDKATAGDIVARLRSAPAGKVDDLFARLAKTSSTDPGSADKGGDLGYNPPGTFVPPFERALEKLAEGEISDPVKTQFGWHVIRLVDRRVAPFEEVRDTIAQQVSGESQDAAWSGYLEKVYDDAGVRINPEYGELDVVSGQITDPGAQQVPGAEAPNSGSSPQPSPTIPAEGGG